MRGLDTNVVVRYLTQDDPVQARKASALIDEAISKQEKLHLDEVVLCELVWVLRGAYRLDKQTVVGVLDRILSAGQFSILDRDLVADAMNAFRDGGGDFADYLLGHRNRKAGCNVTATFDRPLERSDLFQLL
jgi:predicted nucleic-acid-binding protein